MRVERRECLCKGLTSRLIDSFHTFILAGVIREEIAPMDPMNQNTVNILSLIVYHKVT